MVTNSWTLRGN